MEYQLNISFQSEKTVVCEDRLDCSEVACAFVLMEFTDTASLFEESLLEEFIINTHEMKQVFNIVFLIQKISFSLVSW